MAKKKKQTKAERREARLRKARQWVLTYEGSHIVRAYRKRFQVDTKCAMKDLSEIGALSPEKRAEMQQAEKIRLEQLRKKREEKAIQSYDELFPDSDGRFFYIVGYTSGGAPYGVTWEEMGFGPWGLPDDEW